MLRTLPLLAGLVTCPSLRQVLCRAATQMGKKTDKLYITHSEWSLNQATGGMAFGGVATIRTGQQATRRLAFDCCALSLRPAADPVCIPAEGVVFDLKCLEEF